MGELRTVSRRFFEGLWDRVPVFGLAFLQKNLESLNTFAWRAFLSSFLLSLRTV
jgi:hypothetical protein